MMKNTDHEGESTVVTPSLSSEGGIELITSDDSADNNNSPFIITTDLQVVQSTEPSEGTKAALESATTTQLCGCSHLECNRCATPQKWSCLTQNELNIRTLGQLQTLLIELQTIVADVNDQLMRGLEQRHYLQEEADIRNVAIEQLLKMQEKKYCESSEPLAIQMSVVL